MVVERDRPAVISAVVFPTATGRSSRNLYYARDVVQSKERGAQGRK